MSFLSTIMHHIDGAPEGALLVEMDGSRKVPTRNRELAVLIARARGSLRRRGVASGDRVVLLAPNSTRWAAADLAILAEGAICVPMYARQDATELVAMMKDAEAAVVIVADEVLGGAVRAAWPEAPLVDFEAFFTGDPVPDLSAPAEPEADTPVTIIYTSGTSGVPKGVVLNAGNVDHMLPVTRDALEALMADQPGRPAGPGQDTVYHYLPFCFAGSRVVLWTCLFRGNPIHISTDLDRIKDELPAVRPSYFLNVPTLLERIRNGVEARLAGQAAPVRRLYEGGKAAFQRLQEGRGRPLLDHAALALARLIVFRRIRQQVGPELAGLICGSAPLGAETQRWFEMIGIPVYQVYGLTETTAIVTMDRPGEAKAGRVGYPIDGVEVRLRQDDGDEEGDEAGTSVGELVCRGPNVFPGYWRNEAATRETFTADGWFRTGDAAEVDGDGNWRIIGRTKNLLVPESGHNVAPEPIEQRLLESLPGAEHVVVFGHGRPFLVALVSGPVDEAAVARALATLNPGLPHYRRIRAFRVTDEAFTPESGLVTANLKLRRRALEAHFAPLLEEMYSS